MNKHSLYIVWMFLLVSPMLSAIAQSWRDDARLADSLAHYGHGAEVPHALELARRALAGAEREFGTVDTNVAGILEMCASLLADAEISRPKEAAEIAERALRIEERLLDTDHPRIVHALNILASSTRGDPLRSLALLGRARAICEKTGRTRDAEYYEVVHNLAYYTQAAGKYAEAEPLYRKALDLCRNVLPPGYSDIAYTLTMLAVDYWSLGLFHEAEPLLKEALDVWQKKFGEQSVQSAICMGNLAEHYLYRGNPAGWHELMKRAIAIFERELPRDDPYLASILTGCGMDLMSQKRYGEAIDTLGQAVGGFRSMKEMSSKISLATRLIGECRLAQHDYSGAEADFLRALALNDSLVPGSSAWGSESLLDLAKTYAGERQFRKADSLYPRILEHRERTLGPDFLDVADVLDAYAECERMQGHSTRALDLLRRAVEIRAKNFTLNARSMSEKSAHDYSQFLRRSVDAFLSAFMDAASHDSAALRAAARIILGTKGQTTEQTILRRRTLVKSDDSLTVQLAERYRLVRFNLAKLYVGGVKETDPAVARKHVDSLEALSDDLESSLARRGVDLLKEVHQLPDPVRIALALPPGAALVEYFRYSYFMPEADSGSPRYLALVVTKWGSPAILNLGDAEPIDRAVGRYQEHFHDIAKKGGAVTERDEAAYRQIAGRVYDLIWKPVESRVGGRGLVFIAPDAALNLVSFAALCGPDHRYLVERRPLHYLSAGRDLLQMERVEKPNPPGCVAFGDPDFDAPADVRVSLRVPDEAVASAPALSELRNVSSDCTSLNEMTAARLAGSRIEVQTVAHNWDRKSSPARARVFLGARASEEVFKREAVGQQVIHLATHGYYLNAACAPEERGRGMVPENPLLQSGLFLAGANLHGKGAEQDGAEDGILTALEVSAMDLRGTGLVVLSACETGLGRLEQGEGVYGLRRAFQLAGARTVISSLWQVPDDGTMKFMLSLYATESSIYPQLLRAVALRQLSECRLRRRPSHPLAWGAFVATGDWRCQTAAKAR